ncbi:MAG: bifunctional chorismate mutase/prephenate dehydratase [Coriobacteriales bacterium]
MELSEIRQRIDETDDKLIELFCERMDLAAEVAASKAGSGKAVLDKSREREILARMRAAAGDKERFANSLYNTLFALSRSYQARLLGRPSRVADEIRVALATPRDVFPQTGTIACQGVEGGYSQMAADRMFPRGNLVYFESFEAVFAAVESGLCQFGVLPIENSSNGSVRPVYDLMQQHRAHIVRSERLFVNHALLVKPGTTLDDIREVRSHEQALGQCSRFIEGLRGKVEVVRCTNTAEAVRQVAESDTPGLAAIGSKRSGELYGLVPLDVSIQNSENNHTRFICISREPAIYAGANRISLILTCRHEPGSLYEVMGKFSALGVNLLKLESYPIVGQDFEFMFFFDLEASVLEEGIVEMLADLEHDTESLIFLGNYAEV